MPSTISLHPRPKVNSISELEASVLEKWDDPAGNLTEIEWYALQSVIQRRTGDGQYPPLEILKKAKDQTANSPLGVLDTPAWLQWRLAHPLRGSRISHSLPTQQDSNESARIIPKASRSAAATQSNSGSNTSESTNAKYRTPSIKLEDGYIGNTKRKHDDKPSEIGPRKASRQTSSAKAVTSEGASSSEVSIDIPQIREDAGSRPGTAAPRRSLRLASRVIASCQGSFPGPTDTFPEEHKPALNDPFKIWQLTYESVSYHVVQMAIRNTIGDAPPITTLIQCRDRGSQTLDPLDSRAWTMWRYGKYLSINLQYLKDASDLIIEAGMVKVIETLLKSTNRHIVQLFIAIFDLLPDYEKQALKEIDVAKTEAERKWLNFFL